MMTSPRLASVLLLVRCVQSSVRVYTEALGLPAVHVSEDVAEVDVGGSTSLLLQRVEQGAEAPLSTGYSPFLNFQVTDFDDVIGKLIQQGAHMDGAIKFPPTGRIAAFKTPDGHMIGVQEQPDQA
ncbi:hypothetical protein PTSG_01474 [Salpingoeca rosetta]|uniref:VOC domain-containing protein n=1 Tax=Salpingoeca rosetta (strain ATCC 50818 / BSB-021) TaxID=946362 RepID=F2U0G1_SALR5|nr:uncharacterized protein PTSG_01474 [Salpingoeca rosetta]EGD80889.1 hypothetical protein PTSG_01474 [Salpingoeca rosetta]|eukprot:XP_004997450.1 hypothetical protein PTSG_01474 [Salpingoeca rosetta]